MVAQTQRITPTLPPYALGPLAIGDLATIQQRLRRHIERGAPIVVCDCCRLEKHLDRLPQGVSLQRCSFHTSTAACVDCCHAVGLTFPPERFGVTCAHHMDTRIAEAVAGHYRRPMHCCRYCWDTSLSSFPAGWYHTPCTDHLPRPCGACQGTGGTHDDRCLTCDGFGATHDNLPDTAGVFLQLPYVADTSADTWLGDTVTLTAAWEQWTTARWQRLYADLTSMTRPGALWEGKAFVYPVLALCRAQLLAAEVTQG